MRIKYILLLFLIFTFSFCLPASAAPSSTVYKKTYDLNGTILMKIQAGSPASKTGEHKTLVRGNGRLLRSEHVTLSSDNLIIKNDSDWAADPSSLRGLEVASTFKLNNGKQLDANQIFAVSVKADRGESGQLAQNISAGSYIYNSEDPYLSVNQLLFTSGGEVKRYIDLIEPASGEYIFEDTTVQGYALITDSLQIADDIDNASIENEHEILSGQEEKEEISLVFEEGKYFELIVPLGTKFEELILPEVLEISFDQITITDVFVEWQDQTTPIYDPNQIDSYVFKGELIFPDQINTPENIVLYCIVHVVEEVSEKAKDGLEEIVFEEISGAN